MNELVAGIELGTSRTVFTVGDVGEPGEMSLVSTAAIPSRGIRKSAVVNESFAVASLKSVIDVAEKKNDLSIYNASLAVTGQHVRTKKFSCSTHFPSRRIVQDDIIDLEAKTFNMVEDSLDQNECRIIHVFDIDYEVDGMPGIANPVGLVAHEVKQNVLALYIDAGIVDNAVNACSEGKLEIDNVCFAPYAAAMAVTTPEDRRNGVLVLDMGGGSTGYILFTGDSVVCAGALGVGGDHVTNDIATAFSLETGPAEKLKRECANAILSGDGGRIALEETMPGFSARSISRRALETVVNARMKEIFACILSDIEASGAGIGPNLKVILSGGGAKLANVDVLAREVLGLKCELANIVNVKGFDAKRSREFLDMAVTAGLLVCSVQKPDEKKPLVAKLFGSVKKLFGGE